ncbi:MAG: dienelactone hydrolase family protein, partial [Pseudomonadota bacterium]|nr:dienelactone hydrolase family protein [Pseudomonadota bacterium]
FGRVNYPTGELWHLKVPVIGEFATHYMWVSRYMVTLFELGMLRAGKRSISHWYHAGHAFVNSTRSKYDGAEAKLALKRTLAFLREELGPTYSALLAPAIFKLNRTFRFAGFSQTVDIAEI